MIIEQVDYQHFFKPIVRPNWDEYFIQMLDIIKLRSCDCNTQVGAILVDEKHRIIGTGYNSFPSGVQDNKIPNYRPSDCLDSPKYLRIIHAEINAICNRVRYDNNKLTAYISIPPCQNCLNCICQNNVKRIVVKDNTYKVCKTNEEQYEYDDTLRQSNIQLETLTQKYEQFTLESKFGWKTEYRWVDK